MGGGAGSAQTGGGASADLRARGGADVRAVRAGLRGKGTAVLAYCLYTAWSQAVLVG